MPTTLSSNLSLVLKATYTNSLDISDAVATLAKSFSDALANGVAVDSADLVWWDTRTVVAGTPDNLDLAGGLTNAFGQTLTFARVKALLVHNKSGTAGESLTIGGNAAALVGWVGHSSDVIKVGPGGLLLVWNPSAAGYAVTPTSADVLQIAADTGDVDYDVVLIGASA